MLSDQYKLDKQGQIVVPRAEIMKLVRLDGDAKLRITGGDLLNLLCGFLPHYDDYINLTISAYGDSEKYNISQFKFLTFDYDGENFHFGSVVAPLEALRFEFKMSFIVR